MRVNWSTVRRWGWRLLKIVVLVSVLGGLVYWWRFAPVPVARHHVARGTIVAEVMGTGTLEARVKATISPKIAGRIGQVLVDQGDRVTADTLLVQLPAFSAKYPPVHVPGKGPQSLAGAPLPGDAQGRSGH